MRTGKGSGGGYCGSPRGLEKAGRCNGYQGFVYIRQLQPCERNIDIETSDIIVVPEASRDFGGVAAVRAEESGAMTSSNRRVPTQRDSEAVRRAMSL